MEILDCLPVETIDLATPADRSCHRFQVEVDRVTESEWSTLLEHFDDANIYQTWAYGAVRWHEKNLSHLVLRSGSDVVAMAQLRIIRPVRLRMGVAYLRWGPICHRRGGDLDHEILEAIAKALHDEYVTKRGLFLEVLPNAFAGLPRAELFGAAFSRFDRGAGISNESYRTFVLDFSPSLDELRGNLDKKWRNQLNAATRNDLEVTEDNSCDSYDEFCELYKQMRMRKHFDSAVDIDEFRGIQERLPEAQRLKILICRQQGKAVAGLVYSALGDSAIYLLGATNADGMKAKGSYRLQWAAIQSLKKNGTRFYDLGGIDPAGNPGVHHFKNGLSGTDVSHMAALSACESHLSAGLVAVGQVLRRQLHLLHRRLGG